MCTVRESHLHFLKMINLGKHWDVEHWPDNWTATTVDGARSAQFEHTLLWVLLSFSAAVH